MNKYEQLIEHIINEDEQSAKELFHQLVVEKSRDIYESLMDEEIGGNQAQGFVQDITNQNDSAQDQGLGEDDEEMDLGSDDEIGTDGDDMDDMGDMGHEETFGGDDMEAGEEGEHQDIESKIDDLSAQLEELKGMLAGDSDLGDNMDAEEPDMDSDFDMDGGDEHEMGGEEEKGFGESANPFAKSGSGKSGSGMSGSGKSGSGVKEAKKMSGSGMSGSGKSGSGKSGSGKMESYKKTDVEIMKEYVDKIGEIYKQEPASGEGKTVGTGGDAPTVNKQSVSLDKGPDFGGSNENIVNGKGDNVAPDGKAYTKPKNIYSKGETTMSKEKFQNAPGSNAGKSAFKTKEKAKDSEGQTTDGSVSVQKKSVQVQNTGKK